MAYYTQNECNCYGCDECEICAPLDPPITIKEIAVITLLLPVACVLAPPAMLCSWAGRKIRLRSLTG